MKIVTFWGQPDYDYCIDCNKVLFKLKRQTICFFGITLFQVSHKLCLAVTYND